MTKPIHAYALAIGGALISLAAVGGTGLARSIAEPDPAGCEVLATPTGGGFALEAVYRAETTTSGTYTFSVQSVGGSSRTSINQGGGFNARSGEVLTLGRTNVAGAAAYDVTLSIDAGGKAIECGGRISLSA